MKMNSVTVVLAMDLLLSSESGNELQSGGLVSEARTNPLGCCNSFLNGHFSSEMACLHPISSKFFQVWAVTSHYSNPFLLVPLPELSTVEVTVVWNCSGPKYIHQFCCKPVFSVQGDRRHEAIGKEQSHADLLQTSEVHHTLLYRTCLVLLMERQQYIFFVEYFLTCILPLTVVRRTLLSSWFVQLRRGDWGNLGLFKHTSSYRCVSSCIYVYS